MLYFLTLWDAAGSQLGCPGSRAGRVRRGGAALLFKRMWTWCFKSYSYRNGWKEELPSWVFPSFQLKYNSNGLLHYGRGFGCEKHFSALVRKLFKWWLSSSTLKFNTSEHSWWSWNEPASLRYTATPGTSENNLPPPPPAPHWNWLWFPKGSECPDTDALLAMGAWPHQSSGESWWRTAWKDPPSAFPVPSPLLNLKQCQWIRLLKTGSWL